MARISGLTRGLLGGVRGSKLSASQLPAAAENASSVAVFVAPPTGNGTTDTAHVQAALDALTSSSQRLEFAEGNYGPIGPLTWSVRPMKISGQGRGVTVLTFSEWGSGHEVFLLQGAATGQGGTLADMELRGPAYGEWTAGVQLAEMDAIHSLANATVRDVKVSGFRCGEIRDGDHTTHSGFTATGNYYGVHYSGSHPTDLGNCTDVGCNYAGNTMAGIAVDLQGGFSLQTDLFEQTHFGFSPYCLYGESSSGGVKTLSKYGTTFVGCSFEDYGNGVIYDESKNAQMIDTDFVASVQFSQDDDYKIAARDKNYAVRLNTMKECGIYGAGEQQIGSPLTVGVFDLVAISNCYWEVGSAALAAIVAGGKVVNPSGSSVDHFRVKLPGGGDGRVVVVGEGNAIFAAVNANGPGQASRQTGYPFMGVLQHAVAALDVGIVQTTGRTNISSKSGVVQGDVLVVAQDNTGAVTKLGSQATPMVAAGIVGQALANYVGANALVDAWLQPSAVPWDQAAGVPSMRSLGTTTTQAAAGIHHSAHAKGAGDAVALGDIATTIGDVPQALIDAIMPRRVEINPFQGETSSVGTWTFQVNTLYLVNGQRYNSSGAQNDSITFDVSLAAGTWEFDLWCLNASSSAIMTVEIDGVSVGTIDLYSAGGVDNAKKTIAGIAVAASGHHTLTLLAATKNGSSSGYFMQFQWLTLRRTA